MRAVSFAVALGMALLIMPASRAHASGALADVDAAARAGGNRPDVARRIGEAVFTTQWPAEVTKVRVDGVGKHEIAGLVISGTKFHRALDPAAFAAEVASLVRAAFASSDVEEVDVWATVPIATYKHEDVSGDRALPTSQTVFAATVRRTDLSQLDALLRGTRDVYWNAGWRDGLRAAPVSGG